MVEYFNNILCVRGGDLIRSKTNPEGVMPKYTYDYYQRGNRIRVLRRACFDTPALVEYDTLPERYRKAWEALHGDPRASEMFAPFAQRLNQDIKAREFFTAHRYGDGQSLSPEVIDQYTNDATIFNTIRETLEVMRTAHEQIRRPLTKQWEHMLMLVDGVRKLLTNGMPKTPITLRRKYDRYTKEGYKALVHRNFGNNSAALLQSDDELADAVLMDLLSHGNQLPAPLIAESYNIWAKANGRHEITQRTVINYMEKNRFDIMADREGRSVWADKYDPVIHRRRPSQPLMLINVDDNDLDLYFYHTEILKNGKTVHNNYFRYKMYVVLDAHCDYILGYAIGRSITVELIREAMRNAMHHIKELTGGYHLWSQTVSDRWAVGKSNSLREYFDSIATYTPTEVGLARAKVIERAFGSEWHTALKRYNNYAGHNITAKEKHNRDFVQAHIKNRITTADGVHQIAQFVETMRRQPWGKTGKSRQEMWLENFAAANVTEERRISTETYLQIFGERHQYNNTLRNTGLTITLSDVKYVYDVPEDVYRIAVGKKVQAIYDPADMSQVLVEGDGLRFVATENNPIPMALADYKPGDRERLDKVRAVKSSLKQGLTADADRRQVLLSSGGGIDAEGLLQARVINKEIQTRAIEIATRRRYEGDDKISLGDLI